MSPNRLVGQSFCAFAPLSAPSALMAQATQIPFSSVPASATTITFETTPQGAPVTFNSPAGNIWASRGVTFDGDDTVTGPFALRSPPNVLSAGPTTQSAIRATLTPHMSLVGAWDFDFVMEAFDTFGNSLGALTHTDGSAGLFGGPAEYGFLGVTSSTPISRVEFRHAFPNNQAFGFHIDDLVFKQGPPPPPPRSSLFLLLTRRIPKETPHDHPASRPHCGPHHRVDHLVRLHAKPPPR